MLQKNKIVKIENHSHCLYVKIQIYTIFITFEDNGTERKCIFPTPFRN